MPNLGKCMLFYLKYAAEMERLYEAEKPKVEGLLNWDPEKIKLVDLCARDRRTLPCNQHRPADPHKKYVGAQV